MGEFSPVSGLLDTRSHIALGGVMFCQHPTCCHGVVGAEIEVAMCMY